MRKRHENAAFPWISSCFPGDFDLDSVDLGPKMTECCKPWDAQKGLLRAREVLSESLQEKEELEKLSKTGESLLEVSLTII